MARGLLIAASASILVAAGPRPVSGSAPQDSDRFSWLVEYDGEPTGRLLQDSRMRSVVESRLPVAVSGRVIASLTRAVDTVSVAEKRYVTATSCVSQVCPVMGLFWLDTERGIGLGVLYDSDSRTLTFGSNGLSGREFPDEVLATIRTWISYGIVGMPEPGLPAEGSFDESVARVEFVNAANTASELEREAFAPPGFQPSPGGPAFSCFAARTRIEATICADTALSLMDLRMSELYGQKRAQSSTVRGREGLLDFQRAWMVRRDIVCGQSTEVARCLTTQYREQEGRLRQWTPD